MRLRTGLVSTLLVFGASLVACGGGGGGSAAPPSGSTGVLPTLAPTGPTPVPTATAKAGPTATPTGVAVTVPSANPANPSSVAINSNPAGLSVTVDGASAGVTPVTPAAAAAYGTHTIVVTPKTAATPFTVTFSNTGSAALAIFYNQTADSSGKLSGGIATSSGSRLAQSVSGVAGQRSARSQANAPAFADGAIAVQYDPRAFTGNRTFAGVEAAHGYTRAQTLVQSSSGVTRVLRVPGGGADAAVATMRGEAGVVSASRIGLRYPAASSTGAVYPNDTYFKATNNGANADQWYLWLIDAQDAWGYGQGTAPIAVIDTGFDPNQTDLASRVTFAETIVNLQLYANTAVDTDGHGTFLAGVAGAQTNNAAGFAGAAYNAPLQVYKIFADGSSSAQTTDEAASIRDAVDNHGAKVILLALQSSPANGPDPVERDAVAYAISKGVTVVAASGDDNGSALDYPAAYPGVISVGASIVNDAGTPGVVVGQGNSEAVASYSNAGPGLSLVAPGGQGSGGDTDQLHWIENLYTTQPASGQPACAAGIAPPDCKILFTGTSPAAALVAGTASLMLTANGALGPAQIAQMLESTTDDIHDPKEGHGRLNAQRAVALAAGDPAPHPSYPLPRALQFVAFAYTNSGSALPVAPAIVDTTYKSGVQVNADGTFRLADVNPSSLPNGTTTYKIGVWLSLAGDGNVHAGDYFASATCSINASCSASLGNLTAKPVTGGTLP